MTASVLAEPSPALGNVNYKLPTRAVEPREFAVAHDWVGSTIGRRAR